MINIWRCANAFGLLSDLITLSPLVWVLSGTPLNEAFGALHQILPQFQKENKLQKVQCIVLTDGEANHLVSSRHAEIKTGRMNLTLVTRRCGGEYFLRDRKTGNYL